jgi:hypothetical protein
MVVDDRKVSPVGKPKGLIKIFVNVENTTE